MVISMRMIIKRTYSDDDMNLLFKMIRKKAGRYEKIKHLLHIKKCSDPNLAERYLILTCIMNNGQIDEEVIIEDRKVFNALTGKRMEIIELVNEKGPISVKELAKFAGRDYKNVYDDIMALEKFLIIRAVKVGKERVALGKVRECTLKF